MDNQNFIQSGQENSQMSSNPKSKSKKNIWVMLGIIIIIIIIILTSLFLLSKKEKETIKKETIKKITEEVYNPSIAFASRFAKYEEIPVNINPKIPVYSINQDLSNVTNINDYNIKRIPESAKKLIAKNGFAVVPSSYNEFFPLYEGNRYVYIPNFITTDSILHNYHLMFDFTLKQLEEQRLSAELKQLSANMLSESLNQYNVLKGTDWENAAKRNVGFFSVGTILLEPSINIPSIVKNEVNQELALIEAHQDIKKSPVMNIGTNLSFKEALKEDYSQYIPRGHYDKTEQLKSYFKSMMWYSRLTFRMKNEDEIKSAILITLALNKENNQKSWDKIYEPVNFFVGKSDDITYYDFKDLIENIYGKNTTLQDIINNKDKFTSFINEAKKLEPPKINSIPIFITKNKEEREEEIKGFRFMGQRFTIDAEIFQKLIYPAVGDKTKTCSEYKQEETNCERGARCLPKGLDIPATLGSNEAKNILNEIGENKYACYSENMSKMQSYISTLPIENWTQNLYWGWLYQLLPLLEKKGEGYPLFMQNNAWTRKELNTFLGSWAELKHDTILYSKQVYAELGAGGEIEEKDDRGYVEPNPYVYARLTSLLKMMREGLEMRNLITSNMKENLSKMEQLTMSLKTISEKELNNENLTEDEYELIRSYGGQLEHFWLEINKDEPAFKETNNERQYLEENSAAIIADVATDPNGKALEVGTGKIFSIYVAIPIAGKLKIASGGVYSYYEFPWPLSDRLTDKKWREMINSGKAPNLPSWTDIFVAK